MKISQSKIKKIFEEVFPKDKRLVINDINRQNSFIVEYEKKLAALSNKLDIKPHISKVSYSGENQQHYQISIDFKGLSYYHYLYIYFNSRNELVFNQSSNSGYIDDNLDVIISFFERFKIEYDLATFEENKKEKINQLKIKAIEANVAQMSKEDNFEYIIDTSTIKVNLHIKISKRNELIIYIPLGKFQETLQNVRSIIHTIKELDERGVQFKIKSFSRGLWKIG